LINLEKNELQNMFVFWLLHEQAELTAIYISPIIHFYAGCHVQFIAVDLSTFWSESAINTVLEHC